MLKDRSELTLPGPIRAVNGKRPVVITGARGSGPPTAISILGMRFGQRLSRDVRCSTMLDRSVRSDLGCHVMPGGSSGGRIRRLTRLAFGVIP